jgi:hypothetical protein
MPQLKQHLTLLFSLLLFSGIARAQSEPPAEETSAEPAACVAKRTDPIFSGFAEQKEVWEAQYQRRRSEFRQKMLEHSDELSKCVERARRRDLIPNSTSTFGIHVDQDGRVTKVALLDSNHANNLYGNCLARTLCAIELSRLETPKPEILVFNFNMRRKVPPQQRPWSLDPLR